MGPTYKLPVLNCYGLSKVTSDESDCKPKWEVLQSNFLSQKTNHEINKLKDIIFENFFFKKKKKKKNTICL